MHFIRCLLWIVTVILLSSSFWSCGGSNNSRSGGAQTDAAIDPNTSSKSPTPVDSPPVTNIDVEDLPPLGQDDIQILSSNDQPKISRLNFVASDATEEQRYLSEYLLIVRASEESCVRLKIRPSTGITSTIPPDIVFGEQDASKELETFSCEQDATAVEASPTEETPVPEEENPAAALNESSLHPGLRDDLYHADLTNLTFIRPGNRAYIAAPASAAICSQRLFRMRRQSDPRVGQGRGIEEVSSKTGYLVATSDNVRIWLDGEIGNPCRSGSLANLDTQRLVLGSLVPAQYADTFDRFAIEHFDNIAAEAEVIFGLLTNTFGATSDVDGNGKFEIFISPDVNRFHFDEMLTNSHDLFTSNIIYKPQDLAVYDSTLNPSGNESEVAYIWSPDPGGIFQYALYPTANSLTSNYIKGYIGQQIMTNIISNAHLIAREGPAEEEWLAVGLSLLASAYVAGNDYSFNYLAEYFASRQQYLSLTGPSNSGLIPAIYQSDIEKGRAGLQALFAWYIHTRKCGQSASMCADLKGLIDTDLVGIANVESYLDDTFLLVLDHFGTTLGVEMADDAATARQIWADKGLPNAPLVLPALQQVRTSAPPLTVEQDSSASIVGGGSEDRAIAGPVLSHDALISQPILPDQDLSVRLQKHSVTFFLLSGLLTKETELSAFLGPNVTITIVPLGDRNSDLRRIHVEKISEHGHMDMRPYNLTTLQDENHTYYATPEHSTSYQVTASRELWALGSIDNFTVNESGNGAVQETDLGDIDAYTISVDPCVGSANETTCRAGGGTQQIVVQLIPRDFSQELKPQILATTTSLELFRGRHFWPLITSVEDSFEQDPDDETQVGVFCESEAFYQPVPAVPDISTFGNCANGGLTELLYQQEVCDRFAGVCTSGTQQSVSFDAYVYDFYKRTLDTTFTGPLYDNYFHAGPNRFPVWNNLTIDYVDEEIIRVGHRPFLGEEILRQFYQMAFEETASTLTYHFYPVLAGGLINPVEPNFDGSLIELSLTDIETLVNLKTFITDQVAIPDLAINCESIGISASICADPHANRVLLEQEILALFDHHKVTCHIQDFSSLTSHADLDILCPGRILTITGSVNGSLDTTGLWLQPSHFILRSNNAIPYTLQTYYRPLFPDFANGASDFCKGKPVAPPTFTSGQLCPVVSGSAFDGDLRYKINLAAQRLTVGCHNQTFEDDFLVCIDDYGFDLETHPNAEIDFVDTEVIDSFTTDRSRAWILPLARRGGELIGKQDSMHYLSFDVPVAQASNINLVVGGRESSQGKYLLRVRVKDSQTITP